MSRSPLILKVFKSKPTYGFCIIADLSLTRIPFRIPFVARLHFGISSWYALPNKAVEIDACRSGAR